MVPSQEEGVRIGVSTRRNPSLRRNSRTFQATISRTFSMAYCFWERIQRWRRGMRNDVVCSFFWIGYSGETWTISKSSISISTPPGALGSSFTFPQITTELSIVRVSNLWKRGEFLSAE
ncbi:MAG: hypothetical protein BWY86_00696 [Candidatus Aminicenantes bacterium ADurb.Bin508]|nr:MAG: hypothetical protein BWY86_00696 [Candidatus Aminicenantes bacterium ADurb.Bin508]